MESSSNLIDDFVPVSNPAIGDFTPVGFTCEVCSEELTYAGKGRKPRFCDEHKPTRGTASKAPTQPRWEKPLEQALTEQFTAIGIGVYAFNQIDGVAVLEGSPKLAASLINVARNNSKVRDGLQKFVEVGAWSQVLAVVAAIAIPIAINHKWIPSINMPFAPQAA